MNFLSRFLKPKKQAIPRLSLCVYDSCETLTLDKFEKCYDSKGTDLTPLIKDKELFEKHYSSEVLPGIWEQLQTEYCDLSGDDNFKSFLNKKSKELAIQIKKSHVGLIIQQLATAYDPVHIEALRGYGYGTKYTFPIDNPEKYQQDLNRLAMSLAQEDMKLQEVQKELLIHEERHKGANMNEGYFNKSLAELSRHMGYTLFKHELSVSQYCNFLSNYREHHKPVMK